ncbi:hypothetical protein KSX_57720 [Ktedonospora formicarum]|uniref:Transposase n=2 Tax=Ktedonospora formicarum TaxID=2778364 RepID=A0A8J3I1I3_9CHLR|nr:hypothetical protein KSX_57720 [Ktedonospora formicarum]
MEDVLDVYCRPSDQARPLICLDEMGKNLVADKHPPEEAKPGQIKREDYTYDTQKPLLTGALPLQTHASNSSASTQR